MVAADFSLRLPDRSKVVCRREPASVLNGIVCGLKKGALKGGTAVLAVSLACCLILFPPAVTAETVTLKDGSVIEGRIVNQNVTVVILETEKGRRAVPRTSIERIEKSGEDEPVKRAQSRPGRRAPGRFERVGRLEYLPDRSYVGAARDAMDRAQKSIDLVMYFLKPGSMETDELIDSLIIAVQRGVKVQVLLGLSGGEDVRHFHEEVCQLLGDNGVGVKFCGGDGVTSTKLLVVDDDVSVLGSHNWTESGLSYNSESSVLMQSKEVGRQCGEYARSLYEKGITLEEMKRRAVR